MKEVDDMGKGKSNIGTIITVAGTYMAFAIGSGFASGQEILQYFAAYGVMGFAALVLFFIVGSAMDTEFITVGQREQFDNKGGVYEYYAGRIFGKFFDFFANLFSYLCYVVMCAGAGATLNQYYGLPVWAGVVIMAAVSGLTVIMGLNRITDIISKIGPALIIIIIIVAVPNIFTGDYSVSDGIALTADLDILKAADTWYMSVLNYAGFGIMYVVVFLPFYGKTLPSVKVAASGQILGVALFCITVLFVMLAMFANIETMSEVQVPILALATNLSPIFGAVFAIIIMFGIYSSAVPLLYGPAIRFVDEKKVSGKAVMLVMAMIGAFIPLFLPYNKLMNIIYTANGYIGVIFIILVAVKVAMRFAGKRKKQERREAE